MRMRILLEFVTVNPKPGISAFAIILNKPESRGYQKIVSNDPFAPLVVDFNCLNDAIDRNRLKLGLETIENITKSESGYAIS